MYLYCFLLFVSCIPSYQDLDTDPDPPVFEKPGSGYGEKMTDKKYKHIFIILKKTIKNLDLRFKTIHESEH